MKKLIYICGLLLINGVAADAMAACTGTKLASTSLRNNLRGKTLCVSDGNGGWEAQEELSLTPVSGALIDYKRGNGDPVDPRKVIGTWSTTNGTPATITFNYTDSSPTLSYTYTVVKETGTLGATGSTYSFCNGTTLVSTVILKAAVNVGCN